MGISGRKTDRKNKKLKRAGISPCGKVTWEASAALPSQTNFPPYLRVGPTRRLARPHREHGDPMRWSDMWICERRLATFRSLFSHATSSPHDQSRGNPCTLLPCGAGQGTDRIGPTSCVGIMPNLCLPFFRLAALLAADEKTNKKM